MLRPDDLRHLHAGDEAFFRTLHARFTQKLRADISRVVFHADDIDDVVQDAWARIFERRTSFANRGSFEGWLRRIGRSVCIDWLRVERKHRMVVERSMGTEESSDVGIGLHDPMEHGATLQQLYELVKNELIALPNLQFEIAVYRWLLGYSTKQTAACAHVAVGTVKAALHQVREKIRAQLPVQSTEEWLELDGSLRPRHPRASFGSRAHHRHKRRRTQATNSVIALVAMIAGLLANA